ncbi:thiol:disulfide interchange protein DsbA/DsbL [Dyella nitratireducens]|uniref:Thiol:disulfide interchange protein n=1 Tax=Dyella nitratireducens TaxID=1849580 RepID=A0ABQ1FR14_9GAMM|nr:thiol:disulfide interchange protein DsbA/DsbL [Dyella nitratireducens]GGA26269.1 thiol:disulfide interchange protein [Dyella nitratireducens]GLQ43569.1 thiol:disulfide interchange protein [Dyella nitratireducens]
MFKTARFRLATMLCGLLLTTACSAAAPGDTAAPFTDGNQYVTLSAPYQRASSSGKVEVVEVFSYACIHCAEFSTYADELRKSLPKDVEFKLVPAPFNDSWVPFARAYYAAKKLGVLDRTHDLLFDKKFKEQYPINSMDEIADFYASQGVNRGQFMVIANSPEVDAQIKKDLALIQAWGVDGTPTIVVDGKYRSANIKSFGELVDLTKWLVQKELNTKQ